MAFASGRRWDANDPPWDRAAVPLAVWEKAVDVATIEYESLVRRIAEIYEQGNLLAWRDARELTGHARRRLMAVTYGNAHAVRQIARRDGWSD